MNTTERTITEIEVAPDLLDILVKLIEHNDKTKDVNNGEIVAHVIQSEALYEEAKKVISKALNISVCATPEAVRGE